MARSTMVRILTIILLLATLLPAAAAQESEGIQESRFLGDRFSIRLIGGLVALRTDVAAGRNLQALIDLEDVLGFDERISTLGLESSYRLTPNRRHAIHFRYANFDRKASAVIEGSVPILDLEFVGAVSSKFVNQMAMLEYQYSFINNGKTEAGISSGLAFYKYELALAGEVVLDGNPDRTEFRTENVDIVAPVPVFGFFINQALRKNLILEINTSFIDLAFGDDNGRIFSTWASLTWFFSPHIGVGAGLSGSDIAYENDGPKKLKIKLRQSAINANVTFVF